MYISQILFGGKMKFCKIISHGIFFLFFSVTTAFPQGNDAVYNLMPVPEKIIRMDGRFRLDTAFTISIKGNPNKRIFGAATRALRQLSSQTGFFFTQDFITRYRY